MLDAELEMPLSKSMSVRAAAMAAAGAAAHTHSAFRPFHISPERAQRIDKRIDRTRHEAGTTGNHHISPRSSGKHCHAETERCSAFSCISHSGAGFSHTPHGLHVGTFGQHAVICSTRRACSWTTRA